MDIFKSHSLKLGQKTELIVFTQKFSRKIKEKYSNMLDNQLKAEKTNVKYLKVVLDQFLTFQKEIIMILRKMACGIKTLQSIKIPFPLPSHSYRRNFHKFNYITRKTSRLGYKNMLQSRKI